MRPDVIGDDLDGGRDPASGTIILESLSKLIMCRYSWIKKQKIDVEESFISDLHWLTVLDKKLDTIKSSTKNLDNQEM